jgi:hypothetical protein
VAYSDEKSISLPLEGTFGPVGQVLFVLLLLSFFGTLLAIFVGSALWPIPIIGMIALLFVPFPTLTIYLAIIFVTHLTFRRLPWGKWRGVLGVLTGALAVATFAFGYPKVANRSFDAEIAQYRQRGTWRPVKLADGSDVTLIRSKDTDIDKGCDSFCFGLLLSGRAKQVTIMTAPAFGRLEELKISGKRYSLVAAADGCLAALPQMRSPNLPSTEDKANERIRLQQEFKINVLNDVFEEGLAKCMTTRDIQNEPRNGWTLINWHNKFNPESYDLLEPRMHARVGILGPRGNDHRVTELFDIYGARVATPAYIWPYGGNAGTGGAFSPRLGTDRLDWNGPDLSLDRWWGFVVDPDSIIQAAIHRVERAR